MPRLISEESDVVFEALPGEIMVGRGPLLKIMDKRVSRNHAALEWKNGNLRLCPRHHNPCFLRKVGESEYTALTRDQWVELHHGDHIALLPDSLRYKVELIAASFDTSYNVDTPSTWSPEERGCGEMTTREDTTAASHRGEGDRKMRDKEGEEGVRDEEGGEGDRKRRDEEGEEGVRDKEGEEGVRDEEGGEGDRKEGAVIMTTSTGRKRTLPSWLSDIRVHETTESKPSSGGSTALSHKPVASKLTASRKPRKTEAASTSNKCPPSLPKRPTGEAEDMDTPPPVKTPRQDKEEPTLPPCPYGAECYRKNPVHFREYSHNTGTDDRPECPYGTSCYRKNPTHRKNFKHTSPPTVSKATRHTRPKTMKAHVSALAGDSDDSDTPPNTYDYTDSFIDDAALSSDSASYGGESEDSDWAPPAERTGGEEREGVESDVEELMEEANSFIANKKMWKP